MNVLARFGGWARGLSPVRRGLLAFAGGAMSALAFAPVECFPALLLGFALLLLLLDAAHESPHPVRAGAFCGFLFGFGQFLVGLHWVGYAFLVDPAAHLWQMPFAVIFLSAGLALFPALSCGLALYFWQQGPARFLVFSVLYGAGEWLRGHIFTGLPWNLPAYGWGASLAVLQSASVIGAYGLSFLTILLGASLAALAAPVKMSWRRAAMPAVMALLFVGLWGWGAWRLAAAPTQYVPGVTLRLVQPNIPQREKYRRDLIVPHWQRLMTLSQRPGNPTHIIWPEAAPDFLLQRSPEALEQIAQLTGPKRSLFTGAERLGDEDGEVVYNSLFAFGPGGQVSAVYDKFHLVPFGEYVPFAQLLSALGIAKLTHGPAGFSRGDGPHVYTVAGAPPMSPLICYEVIFPGAVTNHRSRPGWFVNVTDDSWFGPWAGPRQHLLIARVRAIEEAIPVARAANTGISAVIDAYGRITTQLGLNEMDTLDARLPTALPPSTYARFADVGFMLLLLAGSIGAWILGRK